MRLAATVTIQAQPGGRRPRVSIRQFLLTLRPANRARRTPWTQLWIQRCREIASVSIDPGLFGGRVWLAVFLLFG